MPARGPGGCLPNFLFFIYYCGGNASNSHREEEQEDEEKGRKTGERLSPSINTCFELDKNVFSVLHLLAICSADLKIPLCSRSLALLAGEEDSRRRALRCARSVDATRQNLPASCQPDLSPASSVIITPSCDGRRFPFYSAQPALSPVCASFIAFVPHPRLCQRRSPSVKANSGQK